MSPGSTLSAIEERAFAFAEDVLKQAAALVDAAVAEIVFEDNAGPKLYGLALLCRSISNFRGSLTMARHNQAVECRTLVRSCIENLLLAHQLHEDGVGFVKTLQSHEAWGRISLGESSLKHPGVVDSAYGKIVRGLIKRERLRAPKKMNVKGIAKGDIETMYTAYAQLSHDAAHPSVTALERHLQRDLDGRLTTDIAPPFKPGERLVTLDMACDALLGACLGVGARLGGTSQDDALGALWKQFVGQGLRAAVEL